MARKEAIILCVLFVVVLLGLSSISALDTKIKITTYADHDLNINFLIPPPNIELLESYTLSSGSDGTIEFTFPAGAQNFDITAFVLKDGQKIVYEKFEDNVPGESLHLTLYPGKSTIVKNFEETEATNDTEPQTNKTNETVALTIENTSVTTENDSGEAAPGLTGFATTNEESSSFLSRGMLYAIIGFLFIGIVIFGMLKTLTIKKQQARIEGREEEKEEKKIKVKKLSEKLKEIKEEKKDSDRSEYQKVIEEAEEKIKKAQAEINRLKNKGKIEEIKKRMDADKEELERLTKEED